MRLKDCFRRGKTFWRLLVAAITALAASPAIAQTAADKDPFGYDLRQYGGVLFLALFGGVASFVRKVRSGEVNRYAMSHLIGELTIASFAGLMCFFMCELFGAPKLLTACMVGLFGHLGTKGITWLENRALKRAGSIIDGGGNADDQR